MQFVFNTTLVRGSTFSRGFRYATLLCQSTSPVLIGLGSASFAAQSDLPVAIGQRVRASLVTNPVDDPTQFVEGPVTAYSGTTLTINADLIGGNAGTTYSSWQLSAAVDLTGGAFNAVMRFAPDSCASRARTPVNFLVSVSEPLTGVFVLYLSPAQSALLTLGTYQYKVLFSPLSSSDEFLVVRGEIVVVES